jgi:uncharacterized membrane protein
MNEQSFRQPSQNSSQLPFGSKALLLGGSALVLYGITRRSKPGLALATAGGVLAFKAAQSQRSSTKNAKAVFLVNAQPQQAYDLWREFENLPRFMAHLKAVRPTDRTRSEWTALGPLGREIRWMAEITEDTSGQRIAWRSLPGSDVETTGTVEFRADPQGRGTFVTANVLYRPVGGSFATAFATMLGKHPEFMVREDLRRFKALLETGETPTTAGQTHGPRGIHGKTEQVLFRETTNHPEPQTGRRLARTA